MRSEWVEAGAGAVQEDAASAKVGGPFALGQLQRLVGRRANLRDGRGVPKYAGRTNGLLGEKDAEVDQRNPDGDSDGGQHPNDRFVD